MTIGLIIMVILPDFPDTWNTLTSDMKHVANRRIAIEAEPDVDSKGGMSQVRGMVLAFKDPKSYILAIAYHCITGASGFQNFFPTLTATLGYNKVISLLLVAPPYIFITVYSLCHGFASDHIGNRFWFFVYPIPITIVGFIIFMTASHCGGPGWLHGVKFYRINQDVAPDASAQIVWREAVNARLTRSIFHDFPQNLRRHAVSPDSTSFVDRPEYAAFCDLRCLGPGINGLLYPKRNRNRANVTTLANQICDDPMLLA